jgi:hypothetical protein
MMPLASVDSPSRVLLFVATLAAPQMRPATSVAVADLCDAVFLADGAATTRIPAVHPPMLDRINRLNVVGSAAGANVAPVVNVLPRGAVQGLVDEAVNLPEPPVDTNVAVARFVAGRRPNPAFPLKNEAAVESLKCFVSEHPRSIHFAGFIVNAAIKPPSPDTPL